MGTWDSSPEEMETGGFLGLLASQSSRNNQIKAQYKTISKTGRELQTPLASPKQVHTNNFILSPGKPSLSTPWSRETWALRVQNRSVSGD